MEQLDAPLRRFVRGSTSPRDLDLIGRSLKEKWPVSDDARRDIMERLVDVATNSPKHSLAMKAARLILIAVNQDRQDTREYVKMLAGATKERTPRNQQVNVFSGETVDLEAIHGILDRLKATPEPIEDEEE